MTHDKHPVPRNTDSLCFIVGTVCLFVLIGFVVVGMVAGVLSAIFG